MRKQILSLLLLVCSGSFLHPVLAQQRPLPNVPVDLDILKQLGTRTYTVFESRTQDNWRSPSGAKLYQWRRMAAGYVTLKTRVEPNEIILEEHWGSCCNRAEEDMRIDLHYQRDDLINIQKMVVSYDGYREVFDMKRHIFELNIDDQYVRGPWPADVLSRSALWRFVSFLPRTRGMIFPFERFTISPTPDIADKNVGEISCEGTFPLCYGGKDDVQTTLYMVDKFKFWVRNSDNVLLLIQSPNGSRMMLTDRPCGDWHYCDRAARSDAKDPQPIPETPETTEDNATAVPVPDGD